MLKNFTKLEQIVSCCEICQLYNLDGYTMHTRLRKHQKGGGIIIYIHRRHKFEILNSNTFHFECITGNLTTSSRCTLGLCAVYRPPDKNKQSFITEIERTILSFPRGSDLILLGDINIDMKVTDCIQKSYVNTMYGHGLVSGISNYTRIEQRKGVISKTCIDHMFVRSRLQ